jgi:hypothetical protein
MSGYDTLLSEPASDQEIESFEAHANGCPGCLSCIEKSRLIARIRAAERTGALIVRLDAAVDAWLYAERDALVFDDGEFPSFRLDAFYSDGEYADQFFRLAAATRWLVRRGINPRSIVRPLCPKCRETWCQTCPGTSDLSPRLPLNVTRLMAEVAGE